MSAFLFNSPHDMKEPALIDIEIEAVIEIPQRVPAHLALKTAPSLKPGESMMIAAAFGQPEACAIRDAYAFRENRATRVKTVSRDEFAAMTNRNPVTFSA
jgi:hypothetical protein